MKVLALFLTLSFSSLAGVSQEDLVVKNGTVYDKEGHLYTGEMIVKSANGAKESTVEIVDGKQNGDATYYYATGSIMETGVFYNGLKNGPWVHYNEQGKKTSFGNFVSGKKDGKWIIWDDNGVKRCEMNYTNGDKTGTWYMWDEAGKLLKTSQYGTI